MSLGKTQQYNDCMDEIRKFTIEEIRILLTSKQAAAGSGIDINDSTQISSMDMHKNIFLISATDGNFILRFAESSEHLETLRKEERPQSLMRERVSIMIPDTRVVEGINGFPPYAIHHMIPGEALTEVFLAKLSPVEYEQLIRDLVEFFHTLHSIPLKTACSSLGLDRSWWGNRQKLAQVFGKPLWFSPDSVRGLRLKLTERLDHTGQAIFEETAAGFQKLEVHPDWIIFGHGDLHGYNAAMLAGPQGYRLNGVFDLGCSGILDIHEDLFRISLVSEALMDDLLRAYQELSQRRRHLDRQRIGLYYRAFLFYLMVEQHGDMLEHLKKMLAAHLIYSQK